MVMILEKIFIYVVKYNKISHQSNLKDIQIVLPFQFFLFNLLYGTQAQSLPPTKQCVVFGADEEDCDY